MWARLLERWARPADPAGLAVFRMLFGATMCVGALRFLHHGWVDQFFGQPTYFFRYWGFDWLPVASVDTLHVAMWGIAASAALVALGLFYRAAIVTFFLLFTYVELLDVTYYLNHYVFVSMMAGVLAFLPAHAAWSVDAWRRRAAAPPVVPQLAYDWLRFQVGAVWVSAAIAKMTPDWLLHAQPLNIWLNSRVDTPIIGGFLDIWEVALAASWAGLLYDLSVPFLLLWRRTRPFAFVAVLGFHFMTSVWFAIGMFPLIMIVSATIFFDASWPRRFGARGSAPVQGLPGTQPRRSRSSERPDHASPRQVGLLVVAAIWCAALLILPVRFVAYGGNVLWHEQGMRWAFKVMCREKNGAVTFRVRLPEEGREVLWVPRKWLTAYQEREMSMQPDMILQLAHDVAADFRARGHRDVQIYADVVASLNGRAPARLIDPTIDLTRVSDGLGHAHWILPAPTEPPPRLGRVLLADPPTLAER